MIVFHHTKPINLLWLAVKFLMNGRVGDRYLDREGCWFEPIGRNSNVHTRSFVVLIINSLGLARGMAAVEAVLCCRTFMDGL